MLANLIEIVTAHMNKSVAFGTLEMKMMCTFRVHTVILIACRLIGTGRIFSYVTA